MQRLRKLYIGFCFAILSGSLLGQSTTISLTGDSEIIVIENAPSFIDSSGSMEVNQLISIDEQGGFKQATGEDKFELNRPHQYWLRFSIRNESDREEAYVLNFKNWTEVDVYLVEDGQVLSSHKTGHRIEYKNRDYAHANRNFVLIDFQPQQTKTMYVRLDAAPNNRIWPNDLSFSVGPRSEIDEKDGHFRGIVYAILAAYLVFLWYNLFIYLSTRDKAYLYYLILVFIGMVMTYIYSGYILEHFPEGDWVLPFMFYGERLIVNGFNIAMLFFILEFFHVKERFPATWYRLYMGLLVALMVSMVVMVIDYDIGLIPSFPTYLVFNVATFIFAIKNVRQKYPSAGIFLIGFSMVWVSGLVMISANVLGISRQSDITTILAVPIGQMLEMLIFSLALANRINILQRENEESSRKVIEQLQENRALQQKVNLELEEKVAARTKEIRSQNAIIRQEKDRAEKLLLNILPQATAIELQTAGVAKPKFYEEVSIIFTDFCDFTKISERLSTNALVQELDYCFSSFDDIISRHNLEKIKTIGDSYMCAGGIPISNASHAKDAVNAALEIRKFMETWNTQKKEKGEEPWHLRIGIHTGAVTAGVVGKTKFAYDIWGDAVNLASRMEEYAEKDKINISTSTFQQLNGNFQCTYRGKVEVKNKGLVEMYQVEG